MRKKLVLLVIGFMFLVSIGYSMPPSPPSVGVVSYSQIVGLFGSGSCSGYLKSDGTCATPTGTGDFLADGTVAMTGNLNVSTHNITMTGSIGETGSRLTKGWFTDLEVTNDITIGGSALATLYQPLDASLTALAGITITVDGNNITFPGGRNNHSGKWK